MPRRTVTLMTLPSRFWAKVEKRGPEDCWLWTGATTYGGYGVIGVGHAKLVRAPRVSYEMVHGPIPLGMVVRHKCDTPRCVNPNHLEIGTMRQNVADARSRGRLRGAPRKLTDTEYAALKQAAGTVRSVAKEFGVSHGFVSMVRRGLRSRGG